MRRIHPGVLSITARRLTTELIPNSPLEEILNISAWGFQVCWAIPPHLPESGAIMLGLADHIERYCERVNAQRNGFELGFAAVMVFTPEWLPLESSDPTSPDLVRGWVLQGFGLFLESPAGATLEALRAQVKNAAELSGENISKIIASEVDVFSLHPNAN